MAKSRCFVLDDAGNPIMVDADLKAGQLIDRYGDAGGRFTSPLEDGTPLAYDTRGLPYPESAMDYHKYEVLNDINLENVQKGFDNLSATDQSKLLKEMREYGFTLEDMANPQAGTISEVFGAGGGTQVQLGTSVSWYEKMELLKEID